MRSSDWSMLAGSAQEHSHSENKGHGQNKSYLVADLVVLIQLIILCLQGLLDSLHAHGQAG